MKKKKLISIIVFMLLLAMFASACGQARGTCEACGRNKPLYKLTVEASVLGVSEKATHKLCKPCANATVDELKKQTKSTGIKVDFSMDKIQK